jgi:hypothetical protein
MDIFYKLNSYFVNIGKIRGISVAQKNAVQIIFDNGDSEIFSTNLDANIDLKLFRNTILQVIPCTAPLYNIYENEDNTTYFRERVHFLGLCADGEIRSFTCADGFMELVDIDMANNFIGFFSEENLEDFPENEGR